MSNTVTQRFEPMQRFKPISQGFTLVELMVVVVILTLFAGMMSLSVGSSDSRKNRAFYEQLINSLSYVRLLSAENMQPMGLMIQADNEGQMQPTVVKLDNPYAPYAQTSAAAGVGIGTHNRVKNSMELSGMSNAPSLQNGLQNTQLPTWTVAKEVKLPSLPKDVEISVIPLDNVSTNTVSGSTFSSNIRTPSSGKTLQPWFQGSDVPQALWFGTGGAAPVRIEVRHNERLVGDAIVINPDGRLVIGQEE